MQITSKKQLEFFIASDRMINRGYFTPSLVDRFKNLLIPDDIMTYLVTMRKISYYKNGKGIINKLKYFYYHRKYCQLGKKLGFSIGYDVFGYGLRIPHYGTIVVGNSNHIGNYAVLHTSICISNYERHIGDGFYFSTGAKMTSPLTLGNNISIGANSLVNKSYDDDNALIGGVPARFIKKEEVWYIRDNYEQKVKLIEKLKKQYGL